MRISARTFVVSTTRRVEVVDLTDRVAAMVTESRATEGVVHVALLHTTAALFVGRAEILLAASSGGVETGSPDGWMRGEAGGADSGPPPGPPPHEHGLSVQVGDGRLMLGEWQRLLLAERDGPRPRRLRVQVWGVVDAPS